MANVFLHITVENGNRVSRAFHSLEEAKAYGKHKHQITGNIPFIEMPAAPAPTSIWRYDPEICDWVQTA